MSSATGGGGVYLGEAQSFLDAFNDILGDGGSVKLSWAQWSYADKDESSAALLPQSCARAAWDDTSCSGTFVSNYIKTNVDVADGDGPPPATTTPPPPATTTTTATTTATTTTTTTPVATTEAPPSVAPTPPPPSTCSDLWTARKCGNRIASGGERFCTRWAGGLNCEKSCRETNAAWVSSLVHMC